MAKKKTKQSNFRANESTVVWFAALEQARDQGDAQLAAQARRQLREMGVDVRHFSQDEDQDAKRQAVAK